MDSGVWRWSWNLFESKGRERTAIDYRCAFRTRLELYRTRRALERIVDADLLRMRLHRGDHFFGEQPHAGAAIFVAHRPLDTQDYKNPGAQHAHDRFDLRDERLGRAGPHLHVLLTAHQRGLQLLAHLGEIDRAGV